MRTLIFIYIYIMASVCFAENSISKNLKEFHQDPQKYMDRLPLEIKDGKEIFRGYINYKDHLRIDEQYRIRYSIMEKSPQTISIKSGVTDSDRPEALVDNPEKMLYSLPEMDRLGLMKKNLDPAPWSDSYWPISKGLLAIRYSDPSFPKSKNWLLNYNYYLSKPTSSIVTSGNSTAINQLSPAEKYDLLVGDSNMTLTKFSWALGKKYYDKFKHVQGWMGICHGWSAANHMHAPILDKSITLRTPVGVPIKVYQSDVKAWTSMLWANSSPPTRFVGSRCKMVRPPKDPHGRVLDPACLDTNPASFHLVLINQAGVNNRSFVMDTTYDAQVWNYSLADYKMTYFNPQTLQPQTQWKNAIVPIEKYTIDKFRPYRSPEARYVIGITADVSHVTAVNPSRGILSRTPTKTLRFFYDLELDAEYKIIGGEWYTRSYPDFLWTFDPNAKAMSRGDYQIVPTEWNPSSPIPNSWLGPAQQSSSRGSPLASVILRIIDTSKSRQPQEPVEVDEPESVEEVESAPGREEADSGGAMENIP